VASVGHVAVGMLAARCHRSGSLPLRALAAPVLMWSALSLVPDLDVVGFGLGVRYEDPWGHRGATHSFVFAIVLGAAVGAAAAALRRPAVRTGSLAIAVLASHPLLDTLTNGGLGCALFWPFDLTRYFAPWNPIPVAPIGLAFFSPFGLAVAATEFVQFSPLLLWAWSPERFRDLWARRRAAAVAWSAVVLILVSPLSGIISEAATGFVLREGTEYAAGYSERKLRQIAGGWSEESVRNVLGEPLQLAWAYPSDRAGACFLLFVDAGRVVSAQNAEACRERGVQTGQSVDDVRAALGQPAAECWMYTRSPSGRIFRLRAVCFANGTVEDVMRFWWQD
jgi:inner membrane protein